MSIYWTPTRTNATMGRRTLGRVFGWLVFALTFTTASCAVDRGAAPTIGESPSMLYGHDATPLTISITPPPSGWFPDGGTHAVLAHASGGTGTYKYTWYERHCTLTSCGSNYRQVAHHTNGASDTLQYKPGLSTWITYIVVEVQETNDPGKTGVASLPIEGPQDPPEPTPPSSGMNCDLGSALSSYPLLRYDGNTITYHRRNPCSGTREDYTGS